MNRHDAKTAKVRVTLPSPAPGALGALAVGFQMELTNLLDILERLAAERQARLPVLRQQGRTIVGYFCNYTPRELISALGAIPLRLTGGGDYDSRTRGERYVRVDACPFCKSCLGLVETDARYQAVSVMVVPSLCDQMRRLAEVIRQRFGMPVEQMRVPRTWSDSAPRAMYRRELNWLRARLEERTGVGLTAPALAQAMIEEEEKRTLLRALNETRKAQVPPVTETELLRLVSALNLLSARDCAALLRQQLVRLASGARPAVPSTQSRGPRLMLAGSIIAELDHELTRIVEQRAPIVADLICTGTRSFLEPLAVPMTDDLGHLLTILADYYFDQPGCIHHRPNTRYYDLARRLVREYQVQGVVYKTLLFCDAYQLEAARLERELKLPVLHLNTDYSAMNLQQLGTRVEAFLEAFADRGAAR